MALHESCAMNEELRIRSSVESIRRHMSAIHSRKVRVVLISGVLCMCVGLGALAVIVKKPDVIQGALAFFAIPLQANTSSEVLGSPDPAKAVVNGGTPLLASTTPTTSDNSSSSTTTVSKTLHSLPSNASTTHSTLASSSAGTAATVVPSAETTSPGNISGIPTATAGVEISQELRALSFNATGMAVAGADKHTSRKPTLSERASAVFESSSPESRKVSTTSSVTSRTAYLVVDRGGPKEKMQLWPRVMREVEAPVPEKDEAAAPPASETSGDEPAGASKLWYYISSSGGNSTSDDADDEVFGEGDDVENP